MHVRNRVMSENWNTRITLLQRAKDPDDHSAWEEFVHYYQDFIVVVLKHMNLNLNDQDDLSQDILLRIWKVLPNYNAERAKFRTWLSHIIRNKVIDHYRKLKRLSEKHDMIIEESGEEKLLVSKPEIEQIVDEEWQLYIIKLALKRISSHFTDRAMLAFKLSMDEVSSKDIAEKLGIKQNSVNKLKARVKQRLIKEINLLKTELEPGH